MSWARTLTFRANAFGETDGIIAFTRADICNGGAEFNTCPVHDELGFASLITRRFGRKLRIACFGYRSVGSGEFESMSLSRPLVIRH